MKSVISISLLLFLAIQECSSQRLRYGYVRKRKVDSYKQIIDLKNGFLLVMLHSNQNKIDALHALGRHEEAENLSKKQQAKNKNIMRSFHDEFDFCPVYFFMNAQALDLIEKGIGSVTFLDNNLKQDSSIKAGPEKFLVAEFGNMQMDTAKYFSGYRLSTTDTGAWQKPNYYSTSSFQYQAFIVESPQMIQLKRPFPYFVMSTETDNKIFLYKSIIKKINRRLHSFYLKANEKVLLPRFSPYFKNNSVSLE
jgi:hypothetical protein